MHEARAASAGLRRRRAPPAARAQRAASRSLRGTRRPRGSWYSPRAIRFIGLTARSPCSSAQRNRLDCERHEQRERPVDLRRRAEQQRLHVLVGLGDAVRHRPEVDSRGIGDDASVAQRDERRERPLRTRPAARPCARSRAPSCRAPRIRRGRLRSAGRTSTPSAGAPRGSPCITMHGAFDVEAERRVERERAHVEAVLEQPDAGRVLAALDHGLHQPPPDAGVLGLRIDRDRAHAADRVALVEEVRADDLAVDLGDDAPDLPGGGSTRPSSPPPPRSRGSRAESGDGRGCPRRPRRRCARARPCRRARRSGVREPAAVAVLVMFLQVGLRSEDDGPPSAGPHRRSSCARGGVVEPLGLVGPGPIEVRR